jgi:prevent-host-death family protein
MGSFMKHEVGAFEAKNTLGTLLDRVERGEEVIITRRGKRVARLIKDTGVSDRDAASEAAARIRARRRGVTLGRLRIKDLVDQGRP